jgi:hypothetical protein
MLGGEQAADKPKTLADTETPTDTAPPPGGSADLAGHRPYRRRD